MEGGIWLLLFIGIPLAILGIYLGIVGKAMSQAHEQLDQWVLEERERLQREEEENGKQ